jgi:hypothetical protein
MMDKAITGPLSRAQMTDDWMGDLLFGSDADSDVNLDFEDSLNFLSDSSLRLF